MAIEFEGKFALPTVKEPVRPAMNVKSIEAVATVQLAGRGIGFRAFRNFYEGLLGLMFVAADVDRIVFTHDGRHVEVLKDWPPADFRGAGAEPVETEEVGQLIVRVIAFSAAVKELRARNVPFEFLRAITGTRTMILRDPGGNVVFLVELRVF